MKIYAESNFVLEIVLDQEQRDACNQIVELARQKSIRLSIPAFALTEPFVALKTRSRERQRLSLQVVAELRQVERSASLSRDAETASDLIAALLVRSMQAAEARFGTVLSTLLEVAEVLPLTAATLARADELAFDYRLELPDAIVLASVLMDAAPGSEKSCFANRNTKDFDDPSIVDLLRKQSCSFIGNFDHALAHVESKLRRS